MSGRRVVSGKYIDLRADSEVTGPLPTREIVSVDTNYRSGHRTSYQFGKSVATSVVAGTSKYLQPVIYLGWGSPDSFEQPSNVVRPNLVWVVDNLGPVIGEPGLHIDLPSVSPYDPHQVIGSVYVQLYGCSDGANGVLPGVASAVQTTPYIDLEVYVVDQSGAQISENVILSCPILTATPGGTSEAAMGTLVAPLTASLDALRTNVYIYCRVINRSLQDFRCRINMQVHSY